MARACTTPTGHPDDYEDLAAYAALAGESVAEARAPATIDKPASADTWTHPSCPRPIPTQYAFAAQDASGEWWAYANRPRVGKDAWMWAGTVLHIDITAPNPNWRNTLICRDEVSA